MAIRLEHEIIQLGGEGWPGGMRGYPQGVWINRPGRFKTLRLLIGAAAVVVFSLGAVYYIASQSSALGTVPLVTLH